MGSANDIATTIQLSFLISALPRRLYVLNDCIGGNLAGPLPGKRPSRVAAVAERMTRNSYIFDNGGGLGGRGRVGRVIVGVGIINDEFTAVW